MGSILKYDREIIHDCITLLVMADIHLCRNQNVIDQPSPLNFMVLCRLLKTPDEKAFELLAPYQQIIQEHTVVGSTLVLSAEVEHRAVLEVMLLLNPKWKIA